MGYSNSSSFYRIFNKRTICIKGSVHVILDYTNRIIENPSRTDDDIEQVKIVKVTPTQSIDITENQFAIDIVPNEWRIEPKYPKKFTIGVLRME